MASYRHEARRCPVCRTTMNRQALDATHVEQCEDCGGVFVDWMDGELARIGATARRIVPNRAVDEAAGGNCPACKESLYREEHGGGYVLRCGGCAGAFIPTVELDAIARAAGAQRDDKDEPSFFEALVKAISSWWTEP